MPCGLEILAAGIGILAASASASVRTERVEVGEPVVVVVSVSARPNAMVAIRPPPSNPPAYTVDPSGQRMRQTDLDGRASFTWVLVPWEEGKLDIPPTTLEIGGVRGVRSNALALDAFNPLGAGAADAAPKDIRDIRPFPVRPPLWLFFLAGALIAAIGWWVLRPRGSPPEVPAAEPVHVPPPTAETLAEAMERVRRIAESPPRDPAAARHAHFVIAEAVRRFVEERWEVPASRQTTEEFIRAIARRDSLRGGGMSMLPVVLEACDRVKWAGDRAGPQDTLEVARLALDFFAASRGAIRGLGGQGERAP